MKRRETISYANLPTHLPVMSTLVGWLVLDRTRAPGWVWGVVGTILGLFWIGSIIALFLEDRTDIFAVRNRAKRVVDELLDSVNPK